MDRIKSVLSSNASHVSGTTRFIPDREEITTLQFMGRHSRVKSFTLLNGQEYKVRRESFTKIQDNMIRRGVFFMNTVIGLRKIHTQLLTELLCIRNVVHAEGALTDDDFPPTLKDFLNHDPALLERIPNSARLLSSTDIHDLMMQLAALKLFGN